MNNKFLKVCFLLLLPLIFVKCSNNPIPQTIKLLPNDPFKSTIVPSQMFKIDSKQNQIIEGNMGTVIVCPKGCFINSKGQVIEDEVTIELSEALLIEDMLLSNLTTTSNGNLLETDGMIYFNATFKGEQLAINKDNPIYIEIPTSNKKAGMMAYKGIRDEKGNMNWVEPQVLENYLLTVDINILDFLPPGFHTEVEKAMPYKYYKTATKELSDSLYYQLSNFEEKLSNLLYSSPQNINEPYYNKNKKVINGQYTSDSYVFSGDTNSTTDSFAISKKEIDPAIIKVIKSKQFQNTFIATREFENRLKVIFRTCKNAVLECYINNLDKNLYEVDSMVAQILGSSHECYQSFIDFSNQRLTKVKQANKYAELLGDYYQKQLKKVKSELKKDQEKLIKSIKTGNKETRKLEEKYKKLLFKREKYRMETYGFTWTSTGWINIDKGIIPKTWGQKQLEITVLNGEQFDRVHSYVVYTSIKSLYRLNSKDKEHFFVGNNEEKSMYMPEYEQGLAISIAYKNELPSIAIKEFKTGAEPQINLTLVASSLSKLKEAISPYENYAKENKISTDLEFMAQFYKEQQKTNELQKEIQLLNQLSRIAFPCDISDVFSVPSNPK